jgi:nuclear protein localization family protein 4
VQIRGKFAILENISCKVKTGCAGHLPWPKAICTKCQPSAITLNRQVYRHVDNVNFENSSIVENFLNYWRTTGYQRMGFLYGYYSVHKDVPLGIKATVVAIYEPPQESSRDFIKLVAPDKKAADVEFIANELGLKRIGWVFTDLIPDDIQKGTVKHLRNVETHFLSAQECIMAGALQNSHPNTCRYSPNGHTFGSKFVTICITGDISNAVHMEGYQVSNQCMALVRDNILLPTKDAPELGYVRETSRVQYVPDVYYNQKDGYGNEVQAMARPLPIEYLLVDVPVSTPMDPKFSFNPLKHLKAFPIENRLIEGHIQDFNALSNYLRQFNGQQFLEAVSDFHLLIYLTTMDALPLKETMKPLLQAIRTSDTQLASEWARSDQWATVEQLVLANTSARKSHILRVLTVRIHITS